MVSTMPYLLGLNWTSSLELGIRLMNWSNIWQLIDDKLETDIKTQWLNSIYQHCHFINGHWSRYSSANNHLIGEAAGLFIASITWLYWKESIAWRDKVQSILIEQALKQNYDDGVNKEQAISYQQFVLDFLLFSGLAAQANKQDFPKEYWNKIEKMMGFLASVMDVNGNIPMLGDADDGYDSNLSQESDFCPFKSLLASGAVLFSRADFKFKSGKFDDKSKWLLGTQAEKNYHSLPVKKSNLPINTSFPNGGYYILGSDFETEQEIKMLADAGPLGYLSIAAHGHADALSVTLSVGGKEFLIDPGTYAYHSQKNWRNYFRGTSAHNTVRIDGLDPSIPGGNFMWIKQAIAECTTWNDNKNNAIFIGKHDGYSRLNDPVTHNRKIAFEKQQNSFLISDTLLCKQSHLTERLWHFSEHCTVSIEKNGSTITVNNHQQITVKSMQKVIITLYQTDKESF